MPPFKQQPPSDDEVKKRMADIVERNKALAEQRAKEADKQPETPALPKQESVTPTPTPSTTEETKGLWWQKDDDKPEVKRNEDGTFTQIPEEK